MPYPRTPFFDLGRIVITSAALQVLTSADIHAGVERHARADWGEVSPEDARANNDAYCKGGRLLSAYRSAGDRKFWIITEADRSATTVLLPEDY